MNDIILTVRVSYIESYIYDDNKEKAEKLLMRTICDMKTYKVEGLERYQDRIMELFELAFVMSCINEVEELIENVQKIKQEMNMPDLVAKAYFLKNDIDLPYDIREYIVNMF